MIINIKSKKYNTSEKPLIMGILNLSTDKINSYTETKAVTFSPDSQPIKITIALPW